MPYYKDFDELFHRGSFSLEPEGWKPLVIEYGYGEIGSAQYFYWRLAGTKHTFKSSVSSLNEDCGGDYIGHIKKFLEYFRQEMLGWTLQGIDADWVYEYIKEYNDWVEI